MAFFGETEHFSGKMELCLLVLRPDADFRFIKRSMPLLVTKPFRMNDAIGLDKAETGYNLLMELKCIHQMLNFFIFTLVCLRLAFIRCLGELYHKYLRKLRFIIKFCGKLADQPGSVVVQVRC